ncbi:hypothetical protein [Streptomyces sp. NBC_00203]|uniref:hypothetical protein n=1 Tax=Streptomyces sp. NBC_00203 TaxID=2975680 RepID=UPI00325445E1
MTDHHTYGAGTGTHTVGELVRLVSDRLGLVFTERDSYFRGAYHRASSPDGLIEIRGRSRGSADLGGGGAGRAAGIATPQVRPRTQLDLCSQPPWAGLEGPTEMTYPRPVPGFGPYSQAPWHVQGVPVLATGRRPRVLRALVSSCLVLGSAAATAAVLAPRNGPESLSKLG